MAILPDERSLEKNASRGKHSFHIHRGLVEEASVQLEVDQGETPQLFEAVAEHTACGGVCVEKMCLGAVAHELTEHDGVAHVVKELFMDVRHGDLFARRTCRAGKGCRWGTRFRRPVPRSDVVAPSREDGQGTKTRPGLSGVP